MDDTLTQSANQSWLLLSLARSIASATRSTAGSIPAESVRALSEDFDEDFEYEDDSEADEIEEITELGAAEGAGADAPGKEESEPELRPLSVSEAERNPLEQATSFQSRASQTKQASYNSASQTETVRNSQDQGIQTKPRHANSSSQTDTILEKPRHANSSSQTDTIPEKPRNLDPRAEPEFMEELALPKIDLNKILLNCGTQTTRFIGRYEIGTQTRLSQRYFAPRKTPTSKLVVCSCVLLICGVILVFSIVFRILADPKVEVSKAIPHTVPLVCPSDFFLAWMMRQFPMLPLESMFCTKLSEK